MLQSMRLQRVGHDLGVEKQQLPVRAQLMGEKIRPRKNRKQLNIED